MSFLNPFAHDSGGGSDPFFSSVVQLAHFDGSNGGTTFTNSCPRGNTMTQLGTGQLSTTTPKFGNTSLRGAGGAGAAVGAVGASHADYNFGTGDYTIEFWANPDTLALDFNSAKVYFDMRDISATAAWVPTISAPDALGSIRMFANGAQRIVSSTGVITAATWNYIALCRASGTTRLFVNGTQVGSNFTDGNTYIQQQIRIGCAGNGAGQCIGYFDDLRITNGVGRYTSNFSPPIAAFPNL